MLNLYHNVLNENFMKGFFFEIIEINSYYNFLNNVNNNNSVGFEKNLSTFIPKSVLKKNDWHNLAILNRPFTKLIVS